MGRLKAQIIRQKFWQIWNQTQADGEYAGLLAQMAKLEPRYEAIMARLEDGDEDIARDYVNLCEAVSHRMLECACEEILFPKEP